MKGVTGIGGVPGDILQISIHTPVKGVTDRADDREPGGEISIHTPVKGVTSPAGV